MPTMSAAEFKAKCLAVLDEVNRTREPVTVTKRGRPVARVVPIPAPVAGIYGLAEGTISYAADDDLLSTGETWDAER